MSLYPELPEILVSRDSQDSRIAIVSLNRPPQRNAFTGEMKDSLVEAFGRLDRDDSVKVVILKGEENPGKAFCAGADLSKGDFSSKGRYSEDGVPTMARHRDGGGQTSLAAFKIRKPTIAAINGHAIGIGITMTLGFDIRLAWEDAKIGFVFAQRGIVTEAASSYFLPKLIGHSKAMDLFMTAKVIPASSPSLTQLFSSLHPSPEATVSAALSMARDICTANSSVSAALIKALVWRGASSPEGQHLLDSKAMFVSGNSKDSIEGVQAFRDKRKPKFEATVPRDLPSELWPWWEEVDIVERSGKSKL